MNDQTRVQLRLLAEISAALAAAGVDWWLFGGWAMDAHAGEVTRDHSDIEAYIQLDDVAAARDALVAAGFAAWPGLYPDECQPFTKDGQEIGLWYLTRDAEGRTITPGRWAAWPWHSGSFEGPVRQLDGVTLRPVTLECLLDTKSNFAQHPHGAPLREKDVADIARIKALIAERDRARA
jgi:hypothetical protein